MSSLPELYYKYKKFELQPIEQEYLAERGRFSEIKKELDDGTQYFLSEIQKEYFGLTEYKLSRCTQLEYPWQETRAGLHENEPSNEVISNESMRRFYFQHVVRDT